MKLAPTKRYERILAFILLYAFTIGLMVAFSSYYDALNADTSVIYMVSFVRWTPFMWDQDRYGMLIQLLTNTIRDPVLSVIAQNTLHVFAAIICFFLLAGILYPTRKWLEVGLVSVGIFLLLYGFQDLKEFLTPWQIYSTAFMFALLGLLVSEKSFLLALPLLILGEWCNFAINLVIALIVLTRFLEEVGREGWRETRFKFLRRVLLLLLSTGAGLLIKRPFTDPGASKYAPLPWLEASRGWINVLGDYHRHLRFNGPWVPLLPLGLGLAVLAYLLLFRFEVIEKKFLVVRSFFVGLFVALAYIMIVGGTGFAKHNGFPRRYLIPSIMLWIVVWSGLSINLLAFTDRVRTSRKMLLSVALFPLLMIRFGVPSYGHVIRALHQRYAKIEIPAECTHVMGNYYRVWDSVFYSYIAGRHPLWGIAERGNVTEDLWDFDHFEEPVVCYWKDDAKEAMKMFDKFNLDRAGFRMKGLAAPDEN